MKKFLILPLLCLLILPVGYTVAHNPFTAEPETQHKAPKPILKSKFYVRLIVWQQQLREKMAGLIRETKQTGNIKPFLILAVSAFIYGVLHSAGPGHGKAVALSYILSCKPSLRQGLLFGNTLALTHGLSGIILVLAVTFLFQTGMSSSLNTVTTITQMVSFSLISLLGLFILIRGILQWVRKKEISQEKNARFFSTPYLTAITLGIIPCPGVVMVMLFGVSLQMTWLGILLGVCISMGMASTISLIILTGMSGKAAVLSAASRYEKWLQVIERLIEIAAGILIAGLGLILLSTVL